MWAIEHWDVVPDIMVVAKALSASYAPIAAMVVREHVYQAFGDNVPSPSVQSYGGHGASAAAGAKTLRRSFRQRKWIRWQKLWEPSLRTGSTACAVRA